MAATRKSLRDHVYNVGGNLADFGQTLQAVATPRIRLVETPVVVLPIADDDALLLKDTLRFLSHFPRIGQPGTTMIIRFRKPLKLDGETYSMKDFSFGWDHLRQPAKKAREIEILNEVVMSKRFLPADVSKWPSLLHINEMDCTLQSDGKLALTGISGVSFAVPMSVQPAPIPLF